MAALAARTSTSPETSNDPAVEAAFAALPETMIAEILDGALYTQPRPAPPHTRVASELGGELIPPFSRGKGGPGGWVFRFEPELHLGPKPDKIVPDLAGWRLERMPAENGDQVLAHYAVAPDWVCEVLSPSTAGKDRIKKMRIYARERVGHVWLMDPSTRVLEVYRLEQSGYVLVGGGQDDEVVRAEPFDAIDLPLSLFWTTPPNP